jgi:hypothetical protein
MLATLAVFAFGGAIYRGVPVSETGQRLGLTASQPRKQVAAHMWTFDTDFLLSQPAQMSDRLKMASSTGNQKSGPSSVARFSPGLTPFFSGAACRMAGRGSQSPGFASSQDLPFDFSGLPHHRTYSRCSPDFGACSTPIRRLQPKPPTASGYCYSGRLHSRSYDLFLQPWAFRSCFLRQNRPAVPSFPPFGRTFRDEASFRLRCQFPKDPAPVSVDTEPKPLVSLKPCDSIVERTFPAFGDLLNTRDFWSFRPDSGSLDAQARRSDRTGLCFI